MWDGATKSVYLGRHDTDKPAVMLHKLDYFDSGEQVSIRHIMILRYILM